MSKITVERAERAITAILAQMERDADCLVAGIEIKETEITRADDKRPQHLMNVEIIVDRVPGHNWPTFNDNEQKITE